jgi:hypothetical protein
VTLRPHLSVSLPFSVASTLVVDPFRGLFHDIGGVRTIFSEKNRHNRCGFALGAFAHGRLGCWGTCPAFDAPRVVYPKPMLHYDRNLGIYHNIPLDISCPARPYLHRRLSEFLALSRRRFSGLSARCLASPVTVVHKRSVAICGSPIMIVAAD